MIIVAALSGPQFSSLFPIKHTLTGPIALTLDPNVHKQDLPFLDVFQSLVMEMEIVPGDLVQKYAGKVPYDVYFQTVQGKLDSCVCKVCSKYFSTIVMLNEHKRICKRQALFRRALKERMAIQESTEDISEELEDDAELEVVSWAVDEFVEDEIIEKEELVEL